MVPHREEEEEEEEERGKDREERSQSYVMNSTATLRDSILTRAPSMRYRVQGCLSDHTIELVSPFSKYLSLSVYSSSSSSSVFVSVPYRLGSERVKWSCSKGISKSLMVDSVNILEAV